MTKTTYCQCTLQERCPDIVFVGNAVLRKMDTNNNRHTKPLHSCYQRCNI